MARAPSTAPAVVVERGSVWWVDLDPTRGAEIRKTRPAVVLSADGLNRARRTVVIVPLSTGSRVHPPIVVAMPSVGEGSAAVCDQLHAVDRARLTRIAGTLSREDLRAIEDGVRGVLQL
jgi:mRNA interferase MazF